MTARTLILALLLALPFSLTAQKRSYHLPEGISADDYSSEFVVVRLKNTASEPGSKGRVASVLPDYETSRMLTYLDELAKKSKGRVAEHPLSNIYTVKLSQGQNAIEVINELLTNENVLYAEPYFNHKPLFIPDDPEAQPGGNQYYLTNIRAYDAWTIEKGNENVIIGILDTGVLPGNEDLTGNLFINTTDPINGIDDDNDGLIDNYKGWDIADNDNNPISDTDIHGHGVTGVSSASTNNGIGIAGIGYNSRYLPIKIFKSGSNFISNGYTAIALAADLGCDVINLSWGSASSFSQAGQDIINYAVEEMDAVVVAAAGNTNAFLDFYPASYENVLSVGASNIGDAKANFATYSYKIDLIAPGRSIFVSNGDASFKTDNGTSFSSPMVAGAAALVRARFPDLSAKQVMERVRVNTDDIYAIPENIPYTGLLGSGRLNIFKALTDNINPSLRITDFDYTNGVGAHAYYEDTLTITIDVTNYLFDTKQARATISTNSPYVEVIEDEFDIGAVATLNEVNNNASPFKVKLSENLPEEEELVFRVDFNDGSYQDFQYFTIESSPNYLTVSNGSLAMTAGSAGQLGYNNDIFSQGIGIRYKNQKILDNIGLIITNDETNVVDNAPESLPINIRDHDFEALSKIKYFQNSEADVDARSAFEDIDSPSSYIGLKVEQKLLAWNESPDDYLVVEYRIANRTGLQINELHTGLFADWNLNDRNLNEAGWDASNLLGYVRDSQSDTLYTGIALLSSQTPFYYAVDNKNANGNSADILSTITDEDKYNLVSNGIAKTTAGINGGGNDVSQAIGFTLSNFEVDGTSKIAFAIVSGTSLSELQQAVSAAEIKYQEYINTPPLLSVTEVCMGENAEINPPDGDTYAFYSDVELTNLLFTGTAFTTPPITSSQPYFVVNKDENYDGDVFRVIAKPKAVNADFTLNYNPLLLDETGETEVKITDNSVDGVEWLWDFDNGFTSTVKNPIMNYGEVGSYDISLTVTSDLGCVDNVTKTLEVANRSNKPNTPNQSICKGDELSLSASNATNLRVYSDPDMSDLIFTGSVFETGVIYQDSSFFITSMDSVYESNPKEVKVITSKIKAGFNYQLDTTNLTQKHLLELSNESNNEVLYIWYINDELAGNSTDISYNYSSESSFEVKLLAEDINGCKDSVTQTIVPKVSPQPSVSDFFICGDDSVTIAPDNGKVFLFYDNASLVDPVAKGSRLTLGSIARDTMLYVTSMDSLLESSAAVVNIDVSDLEAAFSIAPDSLDISDVGELTLSQNSIAADNYLWFVNDSLVSNEVVPELVFDNVGVFDVVLQISNAIGCVSETNQLLIITSITGIEDEDELKFSIYPNPTYDYLYFQSPQTTNLKLIDLNGNVFYSTNSTHEDTINMSDWADGIYILEINQGQQTTYKKIVKTSR